jgi:hypothetical protein
MRLLALAFIAAFAATGAVPDAIAAGTHKKHKHRSSTYERYYGYRGVQRGSEGDYYERLADRLPVGSRRWFEQMEREGRFGGQNP